MPEPRSIEQLLADWSEVLAIFPEERPELEPLDLNPRATVGELRALLARIAAAEAAAPTSLDAVLADVAAWVDSEPAFTGWTATSDRRARRNWPMW
jgi:hypothetical protein